MKRPARQFGSVFAIMSMLLTSAAAANSPSKDILFYDPDVNYDALPRIVKALNGHLSAELPGYRLRPVDDASALLEAIKTTHPAYVLVSSESLPKLKKLGGVALLVPEAAGTVFYHKVLVDSGIGLPNLSHKRLAVATGDRAQGGGAKILSMLAEAGLKVDGASVVATTKDFDALLGLTFHQADAALITSDSINLLKNVNPAAVASLRTLWTSGNILRPVLVAMTSQEDLAARPAFVAVFTGIMNSATGKSAMESLGFDRWVPYSADMGKDLQP